MLSRKASIMSDRESGDEQQQALGRGYYFFNSLSQMEGGHLSYPYVNLFTGGTRSLGVLRGMRGGVLSYVCPAIEVTSDSGVLETIKKIHIL